MTVSVLDPCKSPTATITASALTNQIRVVGDTTVTNYAIDPFTVYASWCTVTYSATTGDAALDALLFTFDSAT